MNSQNESLEKLVHLEGKKSLKNMFKIGPIFILPNLTITYLSFQYFGQLQQPSILQLPGTIRAAIQQLCRLLLEQQRR
jgi:hypothetical protein